MPDKRGKQRGGLRGWISTVPGKLITAGAVATALVAVVGLVREVLPDSPPRLRATIEAEDVDREEPLHEFLELTRAASATGEREPPPLAVATASLVQAPEPDGQDKPCPDGSEPPCAKPEACPDGSEPPCPGVEMCPDGSEPPCPDGPGPGPGEHPEPPESVDRFLDPQVVQGQIVKGIKLPHSRRPADEKRTEAKAKAILTGDSRVPDKEVRRVLRGTRVELVDETKTAYGDDDFETLPVIDIERFPPDKREQLVPIGAVVNFHLELEGYEGRSSELRWTLFDAKKKTRVRHRPWLVNRRALRLTPDAPVEGASSQIWVPLPKGLKGPFFARLEVRDDKGVRVDYANSDRFG